MSAVRALIRLSIRVLIRVVESQTQQFSLVMCSVVATLAVAL